MIKLMDNLEIEINKGDILLYRINDIVKIITVDNPDNIDLYNCIEILALGIKRHFISPYPFYWKETNY